MSETTGQHLLSTGFHNVNIANFEAATSFILYCNTVYYFLNLTKCDY